MAPELQHLGSDPEGLVTLAASIEQYLGLRQQDTQQALNAFPAAKAEDATTASLSGSGVVEFLPEVSTAFDGCLHLLHS